MQEPKIIKGGRASLFDRLVHDPVDVSAGDARPAVVHVGRSHSSERELCESIARELSWLLNTRETHRGYGAASLGTYGIPDLSTVCPYGLDHQQAFAQLLSQKIELFEPRLKRVHVTIQENTTQARKLYAMVEGSLLIGTVMEQVAFPVSLDQGVVDEESHE